MEDHQSGENNFISGIQTVCGLIKSSELGFCQCHEHLLIKKGKSYEINNALFMEDIEKSNREIVRYRQAGGCAIVDAQPIGCGRMGAELEQIARDSGIHIIASTGFHKLVFYQKDHWIFKKNEKELSQIFIEEIEKGMYVDIDNKEPKTQIKTKAGIIKTAVDVCGLNSEYTRLFKAAADAQKATGCAMMIHVEHGADALGLLEFLRIQGVLEEKLIFCHMDRACTDMSVHKELCKAGCKLEYDTIGRFKYHSDEMEARIIKEMIDAGFIRNLLISLDTTRLRLKEYTPEGIGLDYILEVFEKILKNIGIKESEIEEITCENPKKILSIERHRMK